MTTKPTVSEEVKLPIKRKNHKQELRKAAGAPKKAKAVKQAVQAKTTRGKKRAESAVAAAAAPEKKRRKRKVKPEGYPKRPLSSYMLFCQAKRAQVQAENPEAKVPQIGSLLSTLWAQLSEDDKLEYKRQADENRETFLQVVETWKQAHPEPEKPKRAPTSFMLFSKEQRERVLAENPKASTTEISKHLGIMWKALTDEQKGVYQAQYEKLKVECDAVRKQAAAVATAEMQQ